MIGGVKAFLQEIVGPAECPGRKCQALARSLYQTGEHLWLARCTGGRQGQGDSAMAHILVADDDPGMRRCIRMALEGAGHQVSEAADGNEALKALREGPADLVLCDLVMPDKEGLETIRELRRDFPALPIIAMSGGVYHGTMDFLALAKVLGAAQTLPKPFTMTRLLTAVNEVLGGAVPPSGPTG